MDRRPSYWNNYSDVFMDIGSPIYGVVEVVPEPGTLLLWPVASGGVLAKARRWRRSTK